jgi:hypothetical protein
MIRALFGLIPPWAYAAFLALVVGMGVVWHQMQVRDAYKRGVADTTAAAQAAALKEQARQFARMQEISDAETIKAREAESAAADLRIVGQRLRQQLARVVGGAAAASAPGGEAAAAPADVRSDVCAALAERSVELAVHADAATRAGLACERAYGSLRAAP